jgi:hypothetical protein
VVPEVKLGTSGAKPAREAGRSRTGSVKLLGMSTTCWTPNTTVLAQGTRLDWRANSVLYGEVLPTRPTRGTDGQAISCTRGEAAGPAETGQCALVAPWRGERCDSAAIVVKMSSADLCASGGETSAASFCRSATVPCEACQRDSARGDRESLSGSGFVGGHLRLALSPIARTRSGAAVAVHMWPLP